MREALEDVYRAFGAYRHPLTLKGCPCCTSEAESRPLLFAKLREIPADAIGKYAFKALTTWGTLDDYKYFLPRILDLTVAGEAPCDFEVTLGKIAYGDFQSWPPAERIAITNFVAALWVTYVKQSAVNEADSLLCGAAKFMDVVPLLHQADVISRGFKEAYRFTCARGDKDRLINSFWDRDSDMYKRVLEWVYAQRTT